MLLVLAAAAVAGAAVTGSWVAVTIAGAAAVLLGAVATKITHSELMASRRDAARDRAEQAQAFREVDERRSLEGVEFAADMQGRIAQREAVVSRLEGRLADAAAELAEARRQVTAEQERAETAEKETGRLAERLADAEERASDAVVRVAELEQEIDVLTAQWQAAEAALAEQNRMRKGA
nr:hypothetical protein [Nocardioides thalensis]